MCIEACKVEIVWAAPLLSSLSAHLFEVYCAKLHISTRKVLQISSHKIFKHFEIAEKSSTQVIKVRVNYRDSTHCLALARWSVRAWKGISIWMIQKNICRKWEISRAPLKRSLLLWCRVCSTYKDKVDSCLKALLFFIMNGLKEGNNRCYVRYNN